MTVSRRIFLQVGSAAALVPAATESVTRPAAPGASSSPGGPAATDGGGGYLFFNALEAAFIEAAVDRLIPPDEVGPGAVQAGVPMYIDRQLHGAWGAGERLYRSGPWQPGSPTQGYQLPFTPAELFRTALRGVRGDVATRKLPDFEKMSGPDQDAYLTTLQTSRLDLAGVPSNVFFESLLGMTIEGYFCDPVYGGNRDMGSWKMIGFPGAYAAYYELVDQHGLHFDGAPRSLAQKDGRVMVMPDIPASVHDGHLMGPSPAAPARDGRHGGSR